VDRLVAWDHERGCALAVGLGFGAGQAAAAAAAERAAGELRRRLERATGELRRRLERARPAPETHAPAARDAAPPFAFFDAETYAKAVALVKEQVAAGNVYQACLTHRIDRPFAGDPWQLYRALRDANPAPFACHLELPEVAVVGSSPERFLRLSSDRRVESRPIKGTRPRARDPERDEENRRELERSAKDRAENLMIVDLVRNDLGRVCETGSVAVPERMAVEAYASVFQMVSTVEGRLREECDAIDLLRASFPPGSMTGAPKIAAMNLCAGLEPVRRAIYSGAIGYFDARGGVDLSVVIRTVFVRGGRAYVHAGGGIVADSDPGAEWRETLDKARPLLAALDRVEGLRRGGG
jgi:aminodeoxychorismate synthase component I